MAWFIGQSTLVIVLAFGLGLVVGWLLWARRMRLLTVEIVAARIRAAEQAAGRSPYGRRITWTSSGRIALDAHAPVGGEGIARIPTTGRDDVCPEIGVDQRGERGSEADSLDAVRRRDVNAGHGGPHIPAPRIEPADVVDHDELDFEGFGGEGLGGDDDLDDPFDNSCDLADDEFDPPLDPRFDPRFLHRLGHQRSTSDLRGLDRFRDLFTPSNGRTPRTPEPRRTEPEMAPPQDVDGPNHPRGTVADSADDTTLAAAGLAGGPTDTAACEPRDRRPDPDAVAEASEAGGTAAGTTAPARADDGTARADDGTAPADAATAPNAADDLTRIDGIGPKAAAALAAAGIRTFDHLAAADGDTVATALRASGVRLTSSVHAWPLAAHRLAVRRIAQRPIAEHPGGPGSTNGHDLHGHDAVGHDVDGHDVDGVGGTSTDRRGGLLPKRRSPGTPARRSIPPDALDPDDLARIEGIGPRFAAALVASGIRTFGQLANADELALRKAIGTSRPTVAPSLPTWPTQARLLATGDEDGFAELTARLIAGRGLDDDLERIDGIGPQTSAALRAAGIRTYRALAASDGNHVRAALENAGMRATPRLATWAAQARLLADGDEEGFADLAGRLGTGRLGTGRDEGPA